MRKGFDSVIIHGSATKDSGTVSWSAIEQFHKENRKWVDIGYHFGIEEVQYWNPKYKYIALIGRSWYLEGAHCKWHNKSFGVCFVGDWDLKEPEEERLIFGIKRIVIPTMKLFNISTEKIFFHRDFNHAKSCPGKKFSKAKFISLIEKELKI